MVKSARARRQNWFAAVLVLLAIAGCGGTWESATTSDLREASASLEVEGDDAPSFDGSFEGYMGYAMRRSPELQASFEAWRASTLHISRNRRLPEPTLSYGYFVRSVETRVGPQRHRFSLTQTIPWPTKLSAGADAASYTARSRQRQFEAALLALRARVADSYWKLWLLHRTREIQNEQRDILGGLSVTVRGRVEVGQASLADLLQVDLNVSRIEDVLAGLDELERSLSARLLADVGAPPGTATPIDAALPGGGLPAVDGEALRAAAHEHPRIESFDLMAEASEAEADRQDADNYPSFMVGVTYIETGEAAMPVQGSGDDPILVSLSMSVPLWLGSYSDEEDAALAESAAHRANGEVARQRADAELEEATSSVRDAQRRIDLYENTLVPQAEGAYRSVLGAYQTGRSTVAAALLAQRDLLQLQLGLEVARSEHARAWARLEHVVGREVNGRREGGPTP